MATHSSIVAWRNPIDREAWRTIQSMGLQKSRMQLSDSAATYLTARNLAPLTAHELTRAGMVPGLCRVPSP